MVFSRVPMGFIVESGGAPHPSNLFALGLKSLLRGARVVYHEIIKCNIGWMRETLPCRAVRVKPCRLSSVMARGAGGGHEKLTTDAPRGWLEMFSETVRCIIDEQAKRVGDFRPLWQASSSSSCGAGSGIPRSVVSSGFHSRFRLGILVPQSASPVVMSSASSKASSQAHG